MNEKLNEGNTPKLNLVISEHWDMSVLFSYLYFSNFSTINAYCSIFNNKEKMLIAYPWNHSSDSRNLSSSLPRKEMWVYRKIWIPKECTQEIHALGPFRRELPSVFRPGTCCLLSHEHRPPVGADSQDRWDSLGLMRRRVYG